MGQKSGLRIKSRGEPPCSPSILTRADTYSIPNVNTQRVAMDKFDFSNIAAKYESYSLVQKSAANTLLSLLEIGSNDDVLDVGCGVGNLTRIIRETTGGNVTGIDPSGGMIKEAINNNRDVEITFDIMGAEQLNHQCYFDVIFCNSAFQWFNNPHKAIRNCYQALRNGGRIGIQAPATRMYSPNFIEAIENVKNDPRTKDAFAHFREPWFFLETSAEYSGAFEETGFEVVFSTIESITTNYTPEEVFSVFSSGAAAGYLNQDFYDVKIDRDYIEAFEEIVREAFVQQAGEEGRVSLVFNRIFLVAIRG